MTQLLQVLKDIPLWIIIGIIICITVIIICLCKFWFHDCLKPYTSKKQKKNIFVVRIPVPEGYKINKIEIYDKFGQDYSSFDNLMDNYIIENKEEFYYSIEILPK
jgi:hypothetical protein